MALPKIATLTETDVKILLSLVQKQTMEELARTSGITYSYLRNRVSKLKTKNYIKEVGRDGSAPVYQTNRLPETESIYELRATSSTNGSIYHIPHFYGQSMTFGEAFNWITRQNNATNAKNSLANVLQWALAIIKVRSYKKYKGEIAVQHPHEDEMRDILWSHIQKAERELKLAKELYETNYLWSGHEHIWQVLSEGEPSEKTIITYNKANKELA
jgi:hypothetical protein